MGLDMYLLAKRKNQKSVGCTGACGGLFPISPKTDKEEIGYWRKAYDLQDKIFEVIGIIDDDPNCKEYELSKKQVNELLLYCMQETFLYYLKNGYYEEDFDCELADLQTGIESFNKAREILNEDPSNKIFYMCWY